MKGLTVETRALLWRHMGGIGRKVTPWRRGQMALQAQSNERFSPWRHRLIQDLTKEAQLHSSPISGSTAPRGCGVMSFNASLNRIECVVSHDPSNSAHGASRGAPPSDFIVPHIQRGASRARGGNHGDCGCASGQGERDGPKPGAFLAGAGSDGGAIREHGAAHSGEAIEQQLPLLHHPARPGRPTPSIHPPPPTQLVACAQFICRHPGFVHLASPTGSQLEPA